MGVERVLSPRIILTGLEFTIGQSGQLRFVEPGTPPPRYDATIGMSIVDAVYQSGEQLWRNRYSSSEPDPINVGGLQVIYRGDTVLISEPVFPRFSINGSPRLDEKYVGKIYDGSGRLVYDRGAGSEIKPAEGIISLLEDMRNR